MAYQPHVSRDHAEAFARRLGWMSIALGLADLFAPRTLGRAVGMEEKARLFQACGVREIVTGIGILAAKDPTPWIWARVAGDAIDAAGLAPALGPDNEKRGNAGIAMAVVGSAALADLCCAGQLHVTAAPPQPPRDYGDRSGFPEAPDRMRGRARQQSAAAQPMPA